MYTVKEAQAMDYLLKRMQYNGLLKQITGENSELKLVVECNNKYISGDFINYQSGIVKQFEFNGPYEYENMTYNNQSIEVFNQLWKSFCNHYLPNNHSATFKRNEDLSVLLEVLFKHVKTVDISNSTIPLRPLIMNIEYLNNELGASFLYLGEKEIDIVSIVQKETESL